MIVRKTMCSSTVAGAEKYLAKPIALGNVRNPMFFLSRLVSLLIQLPAVAACMNPDAAT